MVEIKGYGLADNGLEYSGPPLAYVYMCKHTHTLIYIYILMLYVYSSILFRSALFCSVLFTIEKRCAFFPFNHSFVVSTNALVLGFECTTNVVVFAACARRRRSRRLRRRRRRHHRHRRCCVCWCCCYWLNCCCCCCCFISFRNYSKMDICCWLRVVVVLLFGESLRRVWET